MEQFNDSNNYSMNEMKMKNITTNYNLELLKAHYAGSIMIKRSW